MLSLELLPNWFINLQRLQLQGKSIKIAHIWFTGFLSHFAISRLQSTDIVLTILSTGFEVTSHSLSTLTKFKVAIMLSGMRRESYRDIPDGGV